jgi:hypothetical protein
MSGYQNQKKNLRWIPFTAFLNFETEIRSLSQLLDGECSAVFHMTGKISVRQAHHPRLSSGRISLRKSNGLRIPPEAERIRPDCVNEISQPERKRITSKES